MHVHRIILGSALVLLAGCQSIGGESMPTLTRTGQVKDVVIRDVVEPTSLTVNPGDEVRWINKRQGAVRVIFLNPVTENLNCVRNFGGPLGIRNKAQRVLGQTRLKRDGKCVFPRFRRGEVCGQGRIGQ